MTVRVYVEGGGGARSTKDACREGFRKLFEKIVPPGSIHKVIASGGRHKAFQNFCNALSDHPGEMIMLLVDSEVPVTTGVWPHLGGKTGDRWNKPRSATEEHAHLMVQCMEAWFLADQETLGAYYGEGFNVNALPAQPNVELIPKPDVEASLNQATRNTTKKQYHKTNHAFALLALVDPAKIRDASPQADRFFNTLTRFCNM